MRGVLIEKRGRKERKEEKQDKKLSERSTF